VFEALEKAIHLREKVQQSKDLNYQSEEHKQFYLICKGIPFYRWEYILNNQEAQHNELAKRTHGSCCWNHLIGLPEKHGIKHNLYRYEYNLFQELMKDKPKPTDNIITRQQHKHLAVIKATGLGITEFVLRWIAWMCVRNDDMKGQRVCIVTGPNIALAITLIKRLEELFLNPESEYQLVFDTKETVLVLNGCLIQAFPSHHLDAMRGLTNVAIVFQDEASFFEINQANDAVDVSQRYIAKSDPYLIVVSTPNKPGDMLHQITELPEDKCIYKRIYLPYTVGAGNIFSQKDIEIAKRSTSFEREYNLKFLGLVGNVFLPEKVDAAIALGRELEIYNKILDNPETVPLTQFYIGVDAGFGSSKFAIVLVCIVDEKLFVLETVELDRQEFNYCINKISEVMERYDLTHDNTKIFIDASSPAVVMAVKKSLDDEKEPSDYLEIIARRKKQKIRDPCYDMCVIPVNFSTVEKRNMLANLKDLIDSNVVVLNLERHSSLVLALRTAQATDLILDKQTTQSDDLLDAFGLACHNLVTFTKKVNS
jgi:hypothetical protein